MKRNFVKCASMVMALCFMLVNLCSIAAFAEDIPFDTIKGLNTHPNAIVSNLNLDTPGVTWTSSNNDVVNAQTGAVTRDNDKSYEVTLTAKDASDNEVAKFDLLVIGDCITTDVHSYSNATNLKMGGDINFNLYGGLGGINTGDGYAYYKAAPGANASVDLFTYGSGMGSRWVHIYASADTTFDSKSDALVSTAYNGNGAGIPEENMEFAIGYKEKSFATTTKLPEGTNYLIVKLHGASYGIMNNLKIWLNNENDVTYEDIKGTNTATADKVISDLDLSRLTNVSSSNPTVVATDGKVTRPEYDTKITITGTIDNDGVKATKKFNLTVLGTKQAPKCKGLPQAISNNGTKDVTVYNGAALEKGHTIKFGADVFYAGTEEKTAKCIAAVYSSAGQLVDLKVIDKELTLSATDVQELRGEFTLSRETADYAKAKVSCFVWDGETLMPLGNSFAVQAKK